MVLYGTGVVVRMRKHTNDTKGLLLFEEVLVNLYRGAVEIKERLTGGEWTIIGRYADEMSIRKYHLITVQP
jgi:hypothetical protein